MPSPHTPDLVDLLAAGMENAHGPVAMDSCWVARLSKVGGPGDVRGALKPTDFPEEGRLHLSVRSVV